MRTTWKLFSALLLIVNLSFAQDTMYTYKAGSVVAKQAITDIDSVTFHHAGSGTFTCGSAFTDSRDGKSYTTVLIGTQCWMKENLNYGTYAASTTPQVAGTKFCQ